ncbi:hypothetical protein CE91St41_20870 [Oscillospiraceae bacterium]|nr:hypothetical protein CE91St40_16650 [Oscillospiraceae bacterium]BDF75198.1 hypothetical protein CE91St41_20870 [Oscillospiraceae bacterium]
MKKRLTAILTLLFCLSMCLPTLAAEVSTTKATQIIWFEDGSHAEIVTLVSLARSTKSGSKSYTYWNSSNIKAFTYTLNGEFFYDTKTSRATSASASYSIYLSGWSLSSHDETASGSTVYGDATFKGPGGASEDVSLTLTCDKNGNIT